MRAQVVIPVIASILILGVIGIISIQYYQSAYAGAPADGSVSITCTPATQEAFGNILWSLRAFTSPDGTGVRVTCSSDINGVPEPAGGFGCIFRPPGGSCGGDFESFPLLADTYTNTLTCTFTDLEFNFLFTRTDKATCEVFGEPSPEEICKLECGEQLTRDLDACEQLSFSQFPDVTLSVSGPETLGGPDATLSFSGPETLGGPGFECAQAAFKRFEECKSQCSFIQVEIDIKPASDPNSINTKSKGTIPVAILSTPDFDALEVDKTTLTFGKTGDETSVAFCTKSNEDVNGDGLLDVVCHFVQKDTGLSQGDTKACIRGQTLDGISIEGCDSIRVKK